MSEKKPVPTQNSGKGKTCPVCGKQSYSREGIHPQCAAVQADATRAEEIREKKRRDANVAKPSSWNKKACPKCKQELHVRQKECQCGHVFF